MFLADDNFDDEGNAKVSGLTQSTVFSNSI